MRRLLPRRSRRWPPANRRCDGRTADCWQCLAHLNGDGIGRTCGHGLYVRCRRIKSDCAGKARSRELDHAARPHPRHRRAGRFGPRIASRREHRSRYSGLVGHHRRSAGARHADAGEVSLGDDRHQTNQSEAGRREDYCRSHARRWRRAHGLAIWDLSGPDQREPAQQLQPDVQQRSRRRDHARRFH